VSTVVEEIAAAGEEQSGGVRQISEAVTQLNSVTQQVAANAEESASASEELAGQSRTLTAMVAEFTITEANTRRPVSRGVESVRRASVARPTVAPKPASRPRSAPANEQYDDAEIFAAF
jgi:methyl-accepting chemotaxis protein